MSKTMSIMHENAVVDGRVIRLCRSAKPTVRDAAIFSPATPHSSDPAERAGTSAAPRHDTADGPAAVAGRGLVNDVDDMLEQVGTQNWWAERRQAGVVE